MNEANEVHAMRTIKALPMEQVAANTFVPNYLVTPGEVLEEYLEALEMPQSELAQRTGLSKKTINEIIKAKSPITPATALKFEKILGRPAHFWSNLERQYQDDKVRLAEKERVATAGLEWLKKFPIKEMVKRGWITKKKEASDQLEEVLRYFGLAAPEQWQAVWGSKVSVAYRQSSKSTAAAESIATWLQQGEIQARNIACAPFDKQRLKQLLSECRGKTRETPDIFVPWLLEQCAAAGVALVIVPALKNTRVFGCTRWLNGKAVIQLSLYYKSNDQFWFTFFHEAAHVIKHGKKEIFIQQNDVDDPKEVEANAFARDQLLPSSAYHAFVEQWKATLEAAAEAKAAQRAEENAADATIDDTSDVQDVEEVDMLEDFWQALQDFAEEQTIAPGIVVGRLQFDGHLSYSQGNKLKVFYQWEEFLAHTPLASNLADA